jgi:putative addiction module component (TIGR02574 family)
MTKTAQAVLQDAMALTEPDREELAIQLLDSLGTSSEAEVEEAWKAEVHRRLDRLDSGEAKLIPWTELRDRIWGRLLGET